MADGNEEKDDAQETFSPEEREKREIQQIQRHADILGMVAWSVFFSLMLLGLIFVLL